ncbi:helix-turn-helix domain protein [Ruminiclostridium papyrosolvens DSM 2782]|uniref:Helix-turn-helix domain protein n=1 Tax=Ruminiclostridium papyrosolvens DSM 2782 TaxID=588581 RepID=F1TIK1_9FIRM|nr:helix-turn-helix transcriptional regulator [Ruminiclostridium papyrosolvens]EGD45818.1 helix-turn-helix domain protein [Ruminiclostridium papyrosolvens DSM 2782]WES33862.1 helix-turn-helix transcriptional regulator [Ruminiclostridium papyrosolvens DSM 2782]
MSFSDNLKKLRKQYKYSQEYLAEKLKTTQQNISLYERGLVAPNIETLTQLADCFRVSVDYLIDYKKDPNHTGLSQEAIDLLKIFDELPHNKKVTSIEILRVLKDTSEREL